MADKIVKVMISLPETLLERVDEDADGRGVTRSAYVRDALRHRLAQRPDLAKRARAIDALRRSFRDARFDESPEQIVRGERDR